MYLTRPALMGGLLSCSLLLVVTCCFADSRGHFADNHRPVVDSGAQRRPADEVDHRSDALLLLVSRGVFAVAATSAGRWHW